MKDQNHSFIEVLVPTIYFAQTCFLSITLSLQYSELKLSNRLHEQV